MELWGAVLVLVALRKRLDAARWILAGAVLVSDLRQAILDIFGLGERWTHLSVDEFMQAPLFRVGDSPVTVPTLSSTLLLISLLYAAWRYSTEQSERQSALQQEFRSAQALQQVLVPESLPVIAGYRFTSAYRPAQEVGGDFFQLIALANDAALLVIGDVSGKGLPAAMAVAMIVGAIRSTAEATSEPAAMLESLNRRLYGRLRGGFATCLAMRMDAEGRCAIANAGHLPPYLNGREVEILPSLPLGLAPDLKYESMELQLGSGEPLVLYTDGVLEARNGEGELFGFARIAEIAEQPAEMIADAAQAFGQDDDITVLTLERVDE
jgi:serine phosphatase RsbU (regulator of sigma subunit)